MDVLEFKVNVVVISEAVGVKKPSTKPFLEALRLLEVSASQTWFVGDHPINDVQGASDVGMKAFWFEREQRTEVVDAVRLENLSELMDLLLHN